MPGFRKLSAVIVAPVKIWRPARYLPGGGHKRVLEHLPSKGAGKVDQEAIAQA